MILGCAFPCVDSGFGINEQVDVVIRPEDMEFRAPGEGMMDGIVTSILFKGVHYEMKVQAGGFEWLAHSTVAYHAGNGDRSLRETGEHTDNAQTCI